jgi:hypothetical protein
MGKAILTVFVVLLLAGYGFLFLSWNQQAVTVTGMALGGQYWIEDNVSVGYVALGAVGVGAVLMAILLGGSRGGARGAGGGQSAALKEALATVERARVKVHTQRDRIVELKEELEAARTALAAATSPDVESPPDEGDEDYI